MRGRRLLVASAVALAAVTSAIVVQVGAGAAEAGFSSSDVGFAEGAVTTGLAGRLDAMDAYVGDRKPILRLDLDWPGVQPGPGATPDFAKLDPIVDAANERGIRVLVILAYGAPWANGGKPINWFPTDDQAWAGIVDATVAHFGSKVSAYEVWNEPNLTKFGQYGDGSVAARRLRYWQLTRIAYERVHAGCAGCTVLAGASAAGDPISEQRNDNEPAQWLDWGYANGYGRYFDAVTHHPYAPWNVGFGPSRPECATRWWAMFGPPDEKCGELAGVRAVMVKRGDAAKKIWGTEFGYPTEGSGITRQTPEQIRDHLEEGIRNWRALDYTGPLFLFSYQDSPGCLPVTDPECHFGLTTAAGVAKQPIYDDVKRALTDTWLDTLAPGRSLHRQSALRSTDGRFHLWQQGDGNLVLYLGGATVLWKVTDRKGVTLTNRADGNLVLLNSAGTVVWSSGTAGKGASDLRMQNDGNLVLYPRATPTKASWSSGTWGH